MEPRLLLTAFLAAATLGIVAAGAQQAPRPLVHRATLDTYCVSCHNARLRTASLLLDQADVDHPDTNAAIWEKVLHKLRAREMPPSGVPHPDDATYEGLAAYLETALDTAAEIGRASCRERVYTWMVDEDRH